MATDRYFSMNEIKYDKKLRLLLGGKHFGIIAPKLLQQCEKKLDALDNLDHVDQIDHLDHP